MTSDQSLLVRPHPCTRDIQARWEQLNTLNCLQNKYDSYCSQPKILLAEKHGTMEHRLFPVWSVNSFTVLNASVC